MLQAKLQPVENVVWVGQAKGCCGWAATQQGLLLLPTVLCASQHSDGGSQVRSPSLCLPASAQQ